MVHLQEKIIAFHSRETEAQKCKTAEVIGQIRGENSGAEPAFPPSSFPVYIPHGCGFICTTVMGLLIVQVYSMEKPVLLKAGTKSPGDALRKATKPTPVFVQVAGSCPITMCQQ